MAATLRNATVVVTGASSGIGRAAALAFASRGANLVLAARRADQLALAGEASRAAGVRVLEVPTDVRDRAACENLIDVALREFGSIDVLVNNAGFAIFDPIERAAPQDLESMMATNYFGAVWCTQAALPHMLGRGRGTIVQVASIAGIMGYAGMGGYCATKFALVGFSEALRNEVRGRGVDVSLVCPGTVETPFFETAERGKMPAASRLILAIPPETVARAIVRSAVDGRYRRIVPFATALYMRFKELSPRLAHLLMRGVSGFLEKK